MHIYAQNLSFAHRYGCLDLGYYVFIIPPIFVDIIVLIKYNVVIKEEIVMEVLAKGQLSYMILSCLCERDMYGLELIEEIKSRFGREIKLPSLYSNINRMKELKYISSYLKESTKGPKCSYSSITEAGRAALESLKQDFKGISVVKPVEQNKVVEEKPTQQYSPISSFNEEQDLEEDIQQSEDYDDYFNLSDEEEDEKPTFVMQSKIDIDNLDETEDDIEPEQSSYEEDDEQINEPVLQEQEEPEEKVQVEQISETILSKPEEKEVEIKQETDYISRQNADDYNRKVYAAAKDFSRNRNKRSYSDNQIELALSTTPARTEENKMQDLTELKTALLQSRQGHYQEIDSYNFRQEKQQEVVEPVVQSKPVKEEQKDDGVFITDRLPEQDIPKPKRIEPPRLNITISGGFDRERNLPAPKRNVAVDPTCSDVKAKLEKLYAKAEVKKQPVVETDFETYDDLKEYYASQEVEFKVYERPERRPKHNTNLLKLYVSLFVFGMISVGSGLMYLIFSLCGVTQAQTNFVYYLFPILAAVYVLYQFYNYKTTVSKIPSQIWNPAIVWTIFALLIAVIFLLNYVCGVSFNEVTTYFSTILFPIYVSACATLGLYYAQIFALRKFWK